MIKAKKWDWKDSNLALFGSDTEKNIKKESAKTEKAWSCTKGLKKEHKHVCIFRIVKFKVTIVDKEDHGQFYDGDSYIIYYQEPKKDGLGVIKDIHFWIGQNSTQDEYGTAAYKTVELDTFHDDEPVQHREVQGHESSLFKSYFQSITIMKGGADSGFRHVKPTEYRERLLKIHGNKKNIETKEVPLGRSSMNESDVFIFDRGLEIIQINTENSNKDERFKAVQYVQQLKSHRSGKPKVTVVGSPDEVHGIPDVPEGDDDDDDDDNGQDAVDGGEHVQALFKLSDASGQMECKQIKSGRITREDLDPHDVFICDLYSEVFVWIGSKASAAEQKNGLTYAHNYLMKTDHPLAAVSVIRHGQPQEQEFLERLG